MSNDRRAVAAVRRLDQADAGRRTSSADPYLIGLFGRSRFETNEPREEVGVVVDAMPAAHCYLVSAGRNSYCWCSLGTSSAGFGVLGVRPLSTVVIGAVVYFTRNAGTPEFGTIRGVDPHWSTHTANQPADAIWPFTRSGQFVEPAHQFPQLYSAAIAGSLGSVEGADFAAGRPSDATTAGEWGVVAETGVAVFVDPFQAYLRVDESTGVFAFYPDSLLRVAGHNYQQYSVIHELERLEDEGELAGWSRGCVYPWESLGLWRYNQVTTGWLSAATTNHGLPPGQGAAFNDPYVSATGSGLAVREPEHYAQTVAARIYAFEGYLGQGGKSSVAAPAQLDWAYPLVPPNARDATVAAVNYPNAPAGRMTVNGTPEAGGQPYAVPPNIRGGPDQPGLFEQSVTLDGDLNVRVAGQMLFSRRVSIPTPRQLKKPEDPYGDAPAGTYKPSGVGNTPTTAAHKVAGTLTAAANIPNRAILLPDVIAYSFNWAGLHPFVYHERDWFVAEEGAAGSDAYNQEPPDYADLALQQYLDTPSPVFIDVDHRYGFAPYRQAESGWSLLDDGSVVIYDGWGSEIRMANGNIELRAAGDVCLYPGRNVVAWAGHDVNVKAHDTVDMAAVNGDVFLRAEYKFHAVSGNGGCGGFLFENKATCPGFDFAGKTGADTVSSGFTVLAPNAAFLVKAQEITLQLDDTSSDGRIFLDAGTSRHVFTRSRTFVSRITQGGSVLHLYDGGGEAVATVNEFAEDYTLIGSNLLVYGKGHFTDCLSTSRWLSAGEHIATVLSADYSQNVAATNTNFGTYDVEIFGRFDELDATYRDAFTTQDVLPPGAEDAEFTHRTTEQYRTTDWVYWESRWQTIAGDQTLWDWVENPVTGLVSSTETNAFPGDRRLETDSYAYVIPTYVDTDNGWIAVSRSGNKALYESATVAAPTFTDVDSALKVTTPFGS